MISYLKAEEHLYILFISNDSLLNLKFIVLHLIPILYCPRVTLYSINKSDWNEHVVGFKKFHKFPTKLM